MTSEVDRAVGCVKATQLVERSRVGVRGYWVPGHEVLTWDP
jgi:hypothetical protein